MDTKLLSKVPTWNGDEDQWFEWSFAFRAYCVVSSLISSEDLERAAGSTTSLPLSGQSPEARVSSGTLYYLLVLLCTEKAQVILRTVEVGNGVEGWRVLSARYDRRDTTSTTGLLQAILGFEMSDDLERIPDKLAEFELMVQRYNMEWLYYCTRIIIVRWADLSDYFFVDFRRKNVYFCFTSNENIHFSSEKR